MGEGEPDYLLADKKAWLPLVSVLSKDSPAPKASSFNSSSASRCSLPLISVAACQTGTILSCRAMYILDTQSFIIFDSLTRAFRKDPSFGRGRDGSGSGTELGLPIVKQPQLINAVSSRRHLLWLRLTFPKSINTRIAFHGRQSPQMTGCGRMAPLYEGLLQRLS